MPGTKVKLLIVDDEAAIRTSLSYIFTEAGHSVRSALDGFTALVEMRREVPDIILSDLNMPGMSGFELLSVVRRRFPAIQVIAMSAAFSGEGVPPGVAADAFYEKGTNLWSLMQIMEAMTNHEWSAVPEHGNTLAPIWIPSNGCHPSGEAYVVITCPECLRTFPQVLSESVSLTQETSCVYCSSLIRYAIVQASGRSAPKTSRIEPSGGIPIAIGLPAIH